MKRLLALLIMIAALAVASFATVSFSPSSLSFGSQAVGTTSAVQFVTFSNSGSTSQSFGTETIAGAYAWGGVGTCGATLAASSNCTMSLVFKPTASGTSTGSLTVGSTVISLTGTGTTAAAAVTFSPSSLSFGSQAVGTTSTVKLVTFSNSGSTSQSFGTETIAGAYAWGGTGTCSSTLAAGSNCTMSLVFKPTVSGTSTGSLTVGSMVVSLSGTGGSTTPTPTPVAISTTSLAKGTAGTAYSATLQASGGTSPYTWSLASGSLPAGLALSTSGTVSGTPSASGTSSFSVTAKDSESTPQSATAALSITVAAAVSTPAALKITTGSCNSGTAGSAYSATLQATGGTSPYTWSLASGSLPAGLALSTSGTISGMPSTSGTSSFSVMVKDSESTPQSVTGALTLAIAATTTPPSGSGTLATAYSSLISANYTAKSSYTSANTYYVSTGGSDSNAGTSSAPWATIAHAASTVSGCALVLVDPGTYTVSSGRTAKITNSGTSACHTAYVATAYASSILNTADNNANDPAVWITGSYVDMVGFDINNPMGCMGVYSNGSYINLTYNRVHDVANGSGAYSCGNGVGGGGILGAIGASNYNNWSDNIVWNVGTIGNHYTHGLYTTSSYNTIQNNIVYNAGGACIQAYHQPSHDIITNNTLVGCGYNGFLFGADSGYSFSNSVFSNNAMYGNSGYDIDACGASGCGVAIGSGNTFSNNDTASSGGNSTGDLSSVGESLVSNITGNPEFVDVASPASGGNFDVASGSPVITAGTSKNAPATDILGVTRNTADPSIGAYEDAN